MPAPIKLQKARMTVVTLGTTEDNNAATNPSIDVQFNPESLKLAYSNSIQGGNQSGGSAMQYIGQSTTKLSFDLWFDVSAPMPARAQKDGSPDVAVVKDVRKLTDYIVGFLRPVGTVNHTENNQTVPSGVPPAVRFEWGDFQFDGIVESVNETIDFFSAEGHGLRSQLSVSMSKQSIPPELSRGSDPGGDTPSPGISLQATASAGVSLQSMAGDLGFGEDWQSLADLNDIEDPRNLDAGAMLSLGV